MPTKAFLQTAMTATLSVDEEPARRDYLFCALRNVTSTKLTLGIKWLTGSNYSVTVDHLRCKGNFERVKLLLCLFMLDFW